MNVVSAAVVLFSIMGLELNGLWKECPSQNGLTLRVLTCNVHGSAFDVTTLNAVIAQNSPDIVALQECPATIIQDCFSEEDWFTEQSGELCVASRFPIRSATALDRRSLGGWGNFALSCQIAAPQGGINVVSVHFLSPRQGLEALRYDRFKATTWAQSEFQFRHEESKLLYRELRGIRDPTIIAGDFNMTPESRIFRKYLHNYADAFTEAGTGFGYTRPTRWHGVRIDHVLADGNWAVKCCRVCDDVGSDHLPVVAELQPVAAPVDETQ
jgi:endonuclease/exonuclease/phosphatase family metal-dependent hydrolase